MLSWTRPCYATRGDDVDCVWHSRLEQYSWRDQEQELNRLPQYRSAFSVPGLNGSTRIHFIHVLSLDPNAIPLLLIPPFPFTNLSFGHLVKLFTQPEDAAATQSFHLVMPSLPGVGFSDALPNNTPIISTTGDILNSLMSRLGYPHYLVSNLGAGSASPAEIDWRLANYLATRHGNSCLGTHLISPPLAQPRFGEAPLEWAKWSIAKLFHAPILGYESEDFPALRRNRPVKPSKRSPSPPHFGLNRLGLREPNTLAYALCDSPTGTLVFVLKSLRLLGSARDFEPAEIINFTQLAWLPGPEAAMRFWAYCAQHPDQVSKKDTRPKVAITVFLGDQANEFRSQSSAKKEEHHGYVCPTWANAKYQVVCAHRAPGNCGLLAWERPELIASGVRNLAKGVLRLDSRLKPVSTGAPAPLEQVVTDNGVTSRPSSDDRSTPTAAIPANSTSQTSTPTAAQEKVASPEPDKVDSNLLAPIQEERGHLPHNVSSETRVASVADENEKPKVEMNDDTLPGVNIDIIDVDTPPARTS